MSTNDEDNIKINAFHRNIQLARSLQRSFLPTNMDVVSGYRFHFYYAPAYEIGGDHFDLVELPSGHVGIVVLDVAGKGVPASLLKAWVSAATHLHILQEQDPVLAVQKLNTFFCRRRGCDGRFVTMIVGVLDPFHHSLKLVNAGHLPPLLFRPGVGVTRATPESHGGFPIGVAEETEYDACTIELRLGDCLLLFTDGVPDARNVGGEVFQLERIGRAVEKDCVYSPDQLGEVVMSAVKQHALGCNWFDDITMVSFGRTHR